MCATIRRGPARVVTELKGQEPQASLDWATTPPRHPERSERISTAHCRAMCLPGKRLRSFAPLKDDGSAGAAGGRGADSTPSPGASRNGVRRLSTDGPLMTDPSWLNGGTIPMADARLGVEDRGFQFADGVYEVIRLYGGKPFTL